MAISGQDPLGMATTAWGKKTLRVLASIYKPKQPFNGRMDKFALG
jgi:hypothetical protein